MRAMIVALLLNVACTRTAAEVAPIKVAAAGDLNAAFQEVAKDFETKTGQKAVLSFGSSGLLSKQIIEGAPFDLFAAANEAFVDEVIAKGSCDRATKAMYARGRIVVWTAKEAKIDAPKSLADLADPRFVKIAIANPEHAPYGRAAKEALEASGVWEAVRPKLVFGENISQTLQFATSGNVEASIVALSLAIVTEGVSLAVSEELHEPLDQAMVVCTRGSNSIGGAEFSRFVASPDGRSIMRRYGFRLPGEKSDDAVANP